MRFERLSEICTSLSKGEVTVEMAKELAKAYIMLYSSEVICSVEEDDKYCGLVKLMRD